MTTAGDIEEETGFAVLSMVCPRFWVSTGERLRILVAAVGKKASISSFVMLFGVGEGPSLSFVDNLACSSMLMSSEM